MTDETGSPTIYIPLLEEGTHVWRPVSARQITPDVYVVVGSQPDDEVWEFEPGSVVQVVFRAFNDDSTGLAAVGLAAGSKLSSLENAVLRAIVPQVPDNPKAFVEQWLGAHVLARRNTGAGFYITLCATEGPRLPEIGSPIGHVHVAIEGLTHGLGFILWLRDGRLHELEGFSYEESTESLDLEHASFDLVVH
jgi:hypothetical protein